MCGRIWDSKLPPLNSNATYWRRRAGEERRPLSTWSIRLTRGGYQKCAIKWNLWVSRWMYALRVQPGMFPSKKSRTGPSKRAEASSFISTNNTRTCDFYNRIWNGLSFRSDHWAWSQSRGLSTLIQVQIVHGCLPGNPHPEKERFWLTKRRIPSDLTQTMRDLQPGFDDLPAKREVWPVLHVS